MAKKKKYSQTFINNIERFNKQKLRMDKLQRAYNIHNQRYYAKAKRHNLLSNQYEIYNRINPFDLTHKQLNNLLKDNARAIKQLGFNSKMSGDLAEASVLTELNNEAFNVSDFSDSEGSEYDGQYLTFEQERLFGEILATSLKELRLTRYQLDKVLDRSILPDYIKKDVREELLEYWKKLRK